MWRKVLFGLALWFSAAQAAAEGLKVIVRNDAGEALPYAYLYVGRKAVAVTDSLGVGTIPAARLAVGDTVSVSYVGTEPQRAVYDAAMQRKGSWEVMLVETIRHSLTSEEVTVHADLADFFNRSLKRVPVIYYRHTLCGRFSVTDRPNTVTGTVAATQTHRRQYHYYPKKEIATQDDTTGMGSENLEKLLHMGLVQPVATVSTVNAANRNARYSYLGREDSCHIFRVAFPQLGYYRRAYSMQFIVRIGIDDRLIRRVQSHIVNLNDETWWTRSDIRYTRSPLRRFGRPETLAVTQITVEWPNGGVTLAEPRLFEVGAAPAAAEIQNR
ncbi:hypothetical protein [uncultured Rikenella sp.]|uniref:hypothetical protein n=1 Tax=uncultured Rikenella sp. TaxID=368003 RepID=UPI002633A5A7|nr:hypothetical protein [uncultured Rikenella sp.]